MANRIKGITVEIGGDTTKLSKALEGVNKDIKGTQTQLKDVQKLLKLDPTNTELLSQKHKLLADAVSATKEKLEVLKTAAEQANTAKTEFLQRMSHDIRTPINGIRGMIELADYYSDDLQKQEECRKKIWDASGLLLELINEVLDMGKLESGEILLEEREFNLKKLLGDIVNVVEKQSKEHQLEIVQCDYQIEHWNLIGSPIHIKRMLMNILSNAVKYNRFNGKILFD